EALECKTSESRFVKAIDKLQALAFVYLKKGGDMHDRHIEFTFKYSRQACKLCPELSEHYAELRRRLIRSIAKKRDASVDKIERLFGRPEPPTLFDDNGEQT